MERVYFLLCLALGRLLRAGRYSKVEIVTHDGVRHVRKRRLFYAPVLVWLGDPLVRILNTGVRILPQRDWVERERLIYGHVYDTSIQIDGDGVLVLPCLHGKTLATLLEDPQLDESDRRRAIELAVVALVRFHHAGFTHGDAMAENVMIDPEAGVARWFDFETVHDPGRPMAWRRADDLRALLATSLLRAAPGKLPETLQLVLNAYPDEQVRRLVTTCFNSSFQRSLTFHLGQAGLSFQDYGEINRLLSARRRSQADTQ